MNTNFSRRRRNLLGLLAGSSLPLAHATGTPEFFVQTEASLQHCIALLEAALQATGFPARLTIAPNTSEERNLHETASGRIHITLLPASPNRLALVEKGQLRMIAVPLERGLLGWRTSFLLQDHQDKTAHIRNLADLQELIIGQGSEWWDIQIYRHASITTRTVQAWRNGEFAEQMRTGAIDLFPMGLEESLSFFLPHFRQHYPDLTLDKHLLLRYPWYRFVWISSHPSADALYHALQKGFDMVSSNGQFETIWEEFRQLPSADFLKGRTVIELENPLYRQDIVPERYRHLLLHPRGA